MYIVVANLFVRFVKKDLDKDLSVLDSEVDSMEFTIYDGWGEDSNGERIIGFTSILVVNIK